MQQLIYISKDIGGIKKVTSLFLHVEIKGDETKIPTTTRYQTSSFFAKSKKDEA
jgi:hypothetical protein